MKEIDLLSVLSPNQILYLDLNLRYGELKSSNKVPP